LAHFLHILRVEITKKEKYMKNQDLLNKIAKLESINDQLSSELNYLEKLTKSLGFSEGLKTLKAAALEMLEEDKKKNK
jgi:hypothetical protein